MLKKYKAKSCVSISVVLPTCGTTHVSFSPLTGGGSVLYTDNAILQEGLEKHPKFGKLFVLVEHEQSTAKANQPAEEEEAPEPSTQEQPSPDSPSGPVRTVEMQNNEDAKEYLAEKFGISRSKLRSRAAIDEAAKANGVQFIWPTKRKEEKTDASELTEDEDTDYEV